jgi:chromosome segregation ATPase
MNPSDVPANGQPLEGKLQESREEIDRLRACLADAERRIRELEEDRDNYRHFAMIWAKEQCKDDDWADFNPDDYTVSAEELMAEIRALDKP